MRGLAALFFDRISSSRAAAAQMDRKTSKTNRSGLFASPAQIWDGVLGHVPAEKMLVKEKGKTALWLNPRKPEAKQREFQDASS
jgi:hypothetical protein